MREISDHWSWSYQRNAFLAPLHLIEIVSFILPNIHSEGIEEKDNVKDTMGGVTPAILPMGIWLWMILRLVDSKLKAPWKTRKFSLHPCSRILSSWSRWTPICKRVLLRFKREFAFPFSPNEVDVLVPQFRAELLLLRINWCRGCFEGWTWSKTFTMSAFKDYNDVYRGTGFTFFLSLGRFMAV